MHAFPLPSPLAHTPPSPPSPVYFLALPSQPLPHLPLLPSLSFSNGGPGGIIPGKMFKLQMRVVRLSAFWRANFTF
jgi:hypothetical protein